MSSNIKTTGSIISGTTDSRLIAEAFLQEIKKHDVSLFWQFSHDFKEIDDFELELGQNLIVEMMEALDSLSPSEYVFSSHPYEPLNYGFWSTTIFKA